jgi:PAS domain S-box-containing protein
MSVWDWLFNPAGLTAHGFCLSWAPGLVALHAASDALIGLAYFSIPLALAWFVRARRDLQYGWIVYLFVAFILACGATHLFSILTLWVPVYGVEGVVKAITAALSIATAVALWPLVPKLLALPSPAQLRALNADLERRVIERTHELQAANARLTTALADRANAQQALMRTEAEFRASFEGAAVGKTQADPRNGQVLRVNRAFARMLGYQPEELVHRNGPELTWPEDREADAAGFERLLGGRSAAFVREKRLKRRDGTPIWVRVSTTIARNPDDQQPFLVISVVEDIEARHKAEADLLAAKAELESTVSERTAALEQRDLLLRELYHRVKNNLQMVDALLLMQAQRTTDTETREGLNVLRGRIYTLGLLHQQLMSSEDLKTFDIAPFLEELASNILHSGENDEVELTVDACSLRVGLDFAIPLGLITTELITNALKHAVSDGGHIQVVLGQESDGSVMLSVADDGGGMSNLDQDGPGLGARIVRGLVSQLDGSMRIIRGEGLRVEVRAMTPAAS